MECIDIDGTGGDPIRNAAELSNDYHNDYDIEALHRRIAQLEQQLQEQSYVIQINDIWINENDMNNSINRALELAMNITGTEAGCLFIYDSDITKLKALEVKGNLPAKLVDAFSRIHLWFASDALRTMIEINQSHSLFPKFAKYDEQLISLVIVPLITAQTMIGHTVVMHRMGEEGHGHTSVFSQQDLLNLKIFAHNTALLLENNRLKIEQGKKEFYIKIIDTLVSAIDAKDLYTQNHSRRVAEITAGFSRAIGIGSQLVDKYEYGALLHDIGKIGVSDAILNKPSSLTMEEFEVIKSHPLKGAKILMPLDLEPDILHIVKHHHERYDGTGYPDGLKGEQIPFSARIVCIIDAWDAMTGKRAYRDQLAYSYAIEELKRGKGSQFDPRLVDQFIDYIQYMYTEFL